MVSPLPVTVRLFVCNSWTSSHIGLSWTKVTLPMLTSVPDVHAFADVSRVEGLDLAVLLELHR